MSVSLWMTAIHSVPTAFDARPMKTMEVSDKKRWKIGVQSAVAMAATAMITDSSSPILTQGAAPVMEFLQEYRYGWPVRYSTSVFS